MYACTPACLHYMYIHVLCYMKYKLKSMPGQSSAATPGRIPVLVADGQPDALAIAVDLPATPVYTSTCARPAAPRARAAFELYQI